LRGGGVPGGDPAARADRARTSGRLSSRARSDAPGRRRLVRFPRAGAGAHRLAGALATGRHVYIRAPLMRDAPALAELARASLPLHRPWVHPPTTAPRVARWLRATGPNRHRLLVCRRDDGAIVGVINISEIVRAAFQSAYLGYYAFRPHAGKG